MKKVIIIFKNELTKLKHQRFPLVALIFTMLFTIAAALFRNSLANVENLNMGQANCWQILSFAASWGMQLAGLLILILSINLVTEEFSDRTIKNILSRPVTRTQFILGKVLTIGFLVLIFLSAIFITSFLTGLSLGDMGHLQERGYVIAKWQKLLGNLIAAFFLSIITLSVIGIFGVFISILLSRPGVAIGTSICLYFVLNIAAQFDKLKNFLFTSFTYFPIDTAKEITYGLTPSWTPQLYWCLLTNILSAVLFIFITVSLLKRKDILS